MEISELLPFWKKLTGQQQDQLRQACTKHSVSAGTLVHDGTENCSGLLFVISGQLRAFILSEEGKEITIYRLFERDMCLFTASCMMNSIEFDISVEAEKDASFYQISADIYQSLMKESAFVSNYTNEVMASRFSDVMWLMNQVLYKKLDSRLAAFLVEESSLSDSSLLKITHETIARHLGSAREVVTRMLKYFQAEHLVALSRGTIEIVDIEKLSAVARDSLR